MIPEERRRESVDNGNGGLGVPTQKRRSSFSQAFTGGGEDDGTILNPGVHRSAIETCNSPCNLMFSHFFFVSNFFYFKCWTDASNCMVDILVEICWEMCCHVVCLNMILKCNAVPSTLIALPHDSTLNHKPDKSALIFWFHLGSWWQQKGNQKKGKWRGIMGSNQNTTENKTMGEGSTERNKILGGSDKCLIQTPSGS